MSRILGIEFSGAQATLTCVTRRGEIEHSLSEPLATHAAHWWLVHPEERVRTLAGLVDRARDAGLCGGGEVAAIGLAADPGFVFLDRDLQVIPPRALPQRAPQKAASPVPSLGAALRGLFAESPLLAEHIGAVLSTLDFIRYRLTGALASHVSFAWATGLVSAVAPAVWNTGAATALGLAPSALLPLFSAECRVGTLGEEMVERLGIPRGIWVNAGSDPVSARLYVAGEPRVGRRITWLEGQTSTGGEAPEPRQWVVSMFPRSAAALPAPRSDFWFEPCHIGGRHSIPESERGAESAAPAVVDGENDDRIERWLADHDGDVVAFDAGGASAGAAIQAGLGLGWWSDLRALWRKHRAPLGIEEWRLRRGRSASAAS